MKGSNDSQNGIRHLLPVMLIGLVTLVMYTIFFYCMVLLQINVEKQYVDRDVLKEGYTKLITFHILLFLLIWSFYKTYKVNPGIVPGELRYCVHEKKYKPDRAHYCRSIKRNVLKMDHYCPWIRERNKRNMYDLGVEENFKQVMKISCFGFCLLGNPKEMDSFTEHTKFRDEIAFLVLENDLPMSFLDIRNEVKDNLLIPKNTFIRIKGRLRYELLFGIPKKKSVQMENTVVERQNSYLLVFRFIDEEKLKTMLTQKRKNEIVKDEKQEKDCISIDVNDYTSEDLEKKYVLDVYNKIAQHFCYTRYKSWNNVENIINQEKEGNIIIDVGCGNGKNVKASSKYFFIGLDFSFYLLKWAQRKHNTDLFLANCISIPLRSNIADLCISIAVIHHIGTHEKRAYEQQENVVGNRKFDSQDIFVPWYLQPQHTLETSYNEAERQAEQQVEQQVEQPAEQPAERQEEEAYREVRPCYPAKKDLLKLQRYYHVFRKEELYELCTSIDGVQVEEFFFDCNNWAIVLRKIF
ncbi:methyltransferase, putative [Plasmodium ovale wallikeri]|uniref:Palmitoyltransferase n=1 Tax=Plasmodium ovale wallikeri TaxID=864142 RepID=A0A1A8YP87_PLAOA|nr:methyltransferase, putative [Plasmodium ovale wallikeri]